MDQSTYLLTLSCPDHTGLVYAVTRWLSEENANILSSQQFDAVATGRFFMRVEFVVPTESASTEGLRSRFTPLAESFLMDWQLHASQDKYRLLLMVSKLGHCLNDLLFRHSIGALNAEIPVIVSNHPDFAELAALHGIPYHHIPVTPESKPEAERRLMDLVTEYDIHLVVLARYMQVLSDDLCQQLVGRAINIHHGFLPSFKGARPYHQAHERGVKVIGATAHYVTPDLDEGPIIEQEVARVDHTMAPAQLAAVGRDAECQALARAVKWRCEQRVMLNGQRTVVFR